MNFILSLFVRLEFYLRGRTRKDLLNFVRLMDNHRNSGKKGVFQKTAHPIKFAPNMAKVLGEELSTLDFATDLMTRSKVSEKIGKGYEEFREFLSR